MISHGVTPHHPRSHLFTLRIWFEGTDRSEQEMRIQVHHVLGGETRYIVDCASLMGFLQAKISEVEDLMSGEG